MTSLQGVILFAHGARDPNWALPFQAVAARAQALAPERQFALAFLEFMAPDLLQCGQTLVAQGCQRIDILPLFLGAGGHVRKDLPALVERLRSDFPEVDWVLHRAAGESPALVEALAQVATHLPEGGA
jgi:sirohydrochlorin cobaltochelatase